MCPTSLPESSFFRIHPHIQQAEGITKEGLQEAGEDASLLDIGSPGYIERARTVFWMMKLYALPCCSVESVWVDANIVTTSVYSQFAACKKVFLEWYPLLNKTKNSTDHKHRKCLKIHWDSTNSEPHATATTELKILAMIQSRFVPAWSPAPVSWPWYPQAVIGPSTFGSRIAMILPLHHCVKSWSRPPVRFKAVNILDSRNTHCIYLFLISIHTYLISFDFMDKPLLHGEILTKGI